MYQQIIFINNTMKVKNFYKILYSLLLIVPCLLQAQVYNNEWIDYNKTYYKFTVGNTGLYRINQANLPAAISTKSGISSVLNYTVYIVNNDISTLSAIRKKDLKCPILKSG